MLSSNLSRRIEKSYALEKRNPTPQQNLHSTTSAHHFSLRACCYPREIRHNQELRFLSRDAFADAPCTQRNEGHAAVENYCNLVIYDKSHATVPSSRSLDGQQAGVTIASEIRLWPAIRKISNRSDDLPQRLLRRRSCRIHTHFWMERGFIRRVNSSKT